MNGQGRTGSRWVLPILLVVLGCSGGPLGPDRTRLSANLEKWRSQNLETYHFTFRVNCFCPPSVRGPFGVSVVDGQVQRAVFSESGEPADPAFLGHEITVEGLFAALDEALEDDPHEFRVEYDGDRGVPLDAFIDFEARVVDEEMGFTVRDFAPGPR